MHRRAFLSTALGSAVVPALPQVPYTSLGALPGGARVGEAGVTAADFQAWLAGFRAKATAQGLPADFLALELAGLSPAPEVVAADAHQPEFSKPISDYLASAVSAGQVSGGRAKRNSTSAWLDPSAVRYGVAAEVLVAIWGMESAYGRVQGDHDVVRAFATLAAQGRRRDWAESQLVSTLKLIAAGTATREELRGSWAGAMGQTQFTPQDYAAYGADGDGDGHVDIWNSAPDALASSANFLRRKAAWRTGQGWAREVAVPRAGFDYALADADAKPWAHWRALGVVTADGGALRPADQAEPARLLLPMGRLGPGFLAWPNHYAIRAYNNSVSYALAVGLLADRVGGGGPLVQPWPADRPTTQADRAAAQGALLKAGFDPGTIDGVLGAGARRAARGWQQARGLPADGWLSYDLVQRLKAEGASSPGLPRGPAAPPAPGDDPVGGLLAGAPAG